eukprot:GHVQ01006059.1.p1 GENE.GHVQ01006059.1~~GHVQ01006059.1.p1  ORF type:complete len:138 (-),score=16.04 GHVQ01006059.1:626-1039(-)
MVASVVHLASPLFLRGQPTVVAQSQRVRKEQKNMEVSRVKLPTEVESNRALKNRKSGWLLVLLGMSIPPPPPLILCNLFCQHYITAHLCVFYHVLLLHVFLYCVVIKLCYYMFCCYMLLLDVVIICCYYMCCCYMLS